MWFIKTISFSEMESLFTESRNPKMVVSVIKVSKANDLKGRWKRGLETLQTRDQNFPRLKAYF